MPIRNKDREAGETGTHRSGIGPFAAALTVLAYWVLALIANPVSRLLVEGRAVLPLVGLRVSWAVLLLALPAAALMVEAVAFIRTRPSARGPERRSPRRIGPFVPAAAVVLFVFNYWNALRLHKRGLTYACGALVVAGTLAAFRNIFRSGGRGKKRGRVALRLAIIFCLIVEALLVPITVKEAGRGRYEGVFKTGTMRPFVRPVIGPDLRGVDLTTRGKGTSGLGRGLGGLRGADLQAVQASGIVAPGLDFRSARLGASILNFANIEGSDFSGADLAQVTLHHARAAGADFSRATLTGTIAVGSGDFRGARFCGAILDYTSWSGVDARDSDWTRADFRKRPGFLCGSDLRGAVFREANLADCVLNVSNFSGADFRGANLRAADIWHSVFHDADFEGADLRGANAEVDQLGRARTLYRAILDPPLAEAIRKKYPSLFEKPIPVIGHQ